jgi:hypothetical protein
MHSGPDRLAFVRGQQIDHRRQVELADRGQLLDSFEVAVLERERGHLKPPARRVLDPSPPPALAELVLRDAQQPRCGGGMPVLIPGR